MRLANLFIWRGVAALMLLAPVLVLGCKRSSSSSSRSPVDASSNYVDPWQAKLDAMRRKYEANEAKLLADWRTAMGEVASGDLDADRLSREVSELVRLVSESTTKLESWNRDLRNELAQRGTTWGVQ